MSQQEAAWRDEAPDARSSRGGATRSHPASKRDRRRDRRRRPAHRAGLRMSVFFALLPPAGGAVLGGLLLTGPDRVPWVLVLGFLAALVSFLLVAPLGRRSLAFSVARYRRATEMAVLTGLTAGALVVYTLVVYLLLDIRTAWVWTLLEGVGLA